MTRIAYVSADLGVPIFGRKGCSIHAQEVLTAMMRQGHKVDVFSTSTEGSPPVGLEQLQVHSLPRPPKGDAAQREQAALAGNNLLLQKLKECAAFDLVYERYSLWSYAAMEFARDSGVPGLMEVNAPLIEEQAHYRVLVDRAGAERAATRAFTAAMALLAVSDEVAAWLEGFPVARGKIHVVPNGVRPERFPDSLVPTKPAPKGVFTVGFVGTLKAWHGLAVLVEAFAGFHARFPQTRLLIVGDGPEREKISADLQARGLGDAALFTGAVAPEEVPGLLASMDVAVAPYPALEHFYFSPLKVYEYMAAGVPVVASAIGQLRDLIQPEVNGILVPPGDPGALAQAFERLIKEPSLRTRLGYEARKTVLAHYTWDAIVCRIMALAGIDQGAPAPSFSV
jgi:glycosyltransferase involved in cell wall biosynthesis